MRSKDIKSVARSQTLRADMTEAETKLWHKLRNRRLSGFKFVRQEAVGAYFADFACREAKLIVEADGSQHADSQHDVRRDQFLVDQGFAVLRFWNHQILFEMPGVVETILAALEYRLQPYDQFKVPQGWASQPLIRPSATFSP